MFDFLLLCVFLDRELRQCAPFQPAAAVLQELLPAVQQPRPRLRQAQQERR